MHLKKKEWVCLVPPAVIEEKRRALLGPLDRGIREALWRQIDVTATPELLTLTLMSVDEEAAHGGYWTGGYGVATHKLAWEDLDDLDGLATRLQHEQVAVFRKAAGLLARLKEHRVALRSALAEV
jgi:hypothetical protein